eukprot:3535769-Pyramimonas_sp.AAC.1
MVMLEMKSVRDLAARVHKELPKDKFAGMAQMQAPSMPPMSLGFGNIPPMVGGVLPMGEPA